MTYDSPLRGTRSSPSDHGGSKASVTLPRTLISPKLSSMVEPTSSFGQCSRSPPRSRRRYAPRCPRSSCLPAPPVDEVRAVGGRGAAPDAARGHAVAGGQRRHGELAVADRKRPVVRAGPAHFLLPAGDRLGQLVRRPPAAAAEMSRAGRGRPPCRTAPVASSRYSVRRCAAGFGRRSCGSPAQVVRPSTPAARRQSLSAAPEQRREVGPSSGFRCDGNAGQARSAWAAGRSRRRSADAWSAADAARPADEARHAHAAFVGRALAALHAAVPAPAVRAVVGEIDRRSCSRPSFSSSSLRSTRPTFQSMFSHMASAQRVTSRSSCFGRPGAHRRSACP